MGESSCHAAGKKTVSSRKKKRKSARQMHESDDQGRETEKELSSNESVHVNRFWMPCFTFRRYRHHSRVHREDSLSMPVFHGMPPRRHHRGERVRTTRFPFDGLVDDRRRCARETTFFTDGLVVYIPSYLAPPMLARKTRKVYHCAAI